MSKKTRSTITSTIEKGLESILTMFNAAKNIERRPQPNDLQEDIVKVWRSVYRYGCPGAELESVEEAMLKFAKKHDGTVIFCPIPSFNHLIQHNADSPSPVVSHIDELRGLKFDVVLFYMPGSKQAQSVIDLVKLYPDTLVIAVGGRLPDLLKMMMQTAEKKEAAAAEGRAAAARLSLRSSRKRGRNKQLAGIGI